MKLTFTKGSGKYDRLDIVAGDGARPPIDCPKQGIIPHDMVHWAVEAEVAAAGFLRLVTHPRVFVEPTPLAAAHDFLAALLSGDGVELLTLGGEWPLLEPLCRQHQLVGNSISDGWIAAAVLARRDCLVTFDRDFVPLLPSRQLVLLKP
jgi:predicted nucleic acid-binding protein